MFYTRINCIVTNPPATVIPFPIFQVSIIKFNQFIWVCGIFCVNWYIVQVYLMLQII